MLTLNLCCLSKIFNNVLHTAVVMETYKYIYGRETNHSASELLIQAFYKWKWHLLRVATVGVTDVFSISKEGEIGDSFHPGKLALVGLCSGSV